MSNPQNNTIRVTSPEETEAEFNHTHTASQIGLEVEHHAVSLRALSPMNMAMFQDLETTYGVSKEAGAQSFEINTPPRQENSPCFSPDLVKKINNISEFLKSRDHAPLPYSIYPFADFTQICETNIHPGQRPQRFLDYFNRKAPERARNFTTVMGIQFSATPSTPKDKLLLTSRLILSSPFLAAMLSSAPPFAYNDDGKFTAIKNNLSLSRRIQAAGGTDHVVPDFFWTIDSINNETGLKYARDWNNAVWDTPLFCMIDPDSPEGDPQYRHFKNMEVLSFRDLAEHLQTRANFSLARSIQYGLAPFSEIPSHCGQPASSRVEARFFDTGTSLHIEAVENLAAGLTFDPEFGQAYDQFLRSCGLEPWKPSSALTETIKALTIGAKRDYKDLSDLPFGNTNVAKAAILFNEQVLFDHLDRYPGFKGLFGLCARQENFALETRQKYSGKDDFRKNFINDIRYHEAPSVDV